MYGLLIRLFVVRECWCWRALTPALFAAIQFGITAELYCNRKISRWLYESYLLPHSGFALVRVSDPDNPPIAASCLCVVVDAWCGCMPGLMRRVLGVLVGAQSIQPENLVVRPESFVQLPGSHERNG